MITGYIPQHLSESADGSYFGGRRSDDGRVDWFKSIQQVHDLIRAVVPPYSGAFTDAGSERFVVTRARLTHQAFTNLPSGLHIVDNAMFGVYGDEGIIAIHELRRVESQTASGMSVVIMQWLASQLAPF